VRLWLGRALIAVVIVWNVQCALAFLISPQPYAAGFELSGAMGEAMVRGMGVLFLMWNVPYVVALQHPSRRRIAVYEALAMQSIGLLGESVIYSTLPAGYTLARAGVARFIAFDAAGLILLLVAAWLTRVVVSPKSEFGDKPTASPSG
jgi:hypothetical protein